MTTPDAQNAPARDDAQGPASTATTLSRFLGGWTRARAAQHPGAETDAGAAGPAGEEPIGAEPADAGPAGEEPISAEPAGAGPDGGLGGAGPVPGPMSAPEAATGGIEDEDVEEDVEEHVFATADPRDFTDDAGPQYEDEDFDDEEAPDAALDARVGRAPAPAPVPSPAHAAEPAPPALAPSSPPAPGAPGPSSPPATAPAPEARRARRDEDAPRDDPEAGLAPLDRFADRFTDRELTWMDFNERVLEQAEDHDLPLLERAWFLAIFSSNLDEFYMVRVAGLMRRIKAGITPVRASGLDAHQVVAEITRRAKELTARQAALWQEDIRPRLAEHNIEVVDWEDLDESQTERLTRYFRHQIYPVLTPLAVDPSHPFPYISGLSLNLAVLLRNPRSGKEHFARLKVPASLPRLVTVPGRELRASDKAAGTALIPLEKVIARHLDHLFPGMDVLEHHLFRVTRNENLEVEEDDAENLLTAMEKELEKRRFGDCVRLEVEDTISPFMRRYLVRALGLGDEDVFSLPAPLDLKFLNIVHDLDVPALKYPRFVPVTAAGLGEAESSSARDVFAAMRTHEVLLHHPYDSFSTSVQEFVSQAAADPKVLAIKQTLYRTSGDSPIVDALIEAAEAGKQVVAIVEIKARFDEENNIGWARKLERAGVHVVYGMVGLKTHCKLLLVVRQESDGLRRYCHVGTGNYHPKTARGYEDLGLLTTDRDVAQDMTTLFNLLSGYAPRARFRRLLVAPRTVRDGLIERIEREIEHKRAGRPAWIRIKVNSIIDEACIDALYRAGRAGVDVDVVVRGICGIRAGVPGLSDNIRVRSILGRFLEHSRIYAFCNDGDTDLYIGSADLMHRNLDRRVEALVRITDPEMIERLTWLVTHAASDAVTSWWLEPDGSWVRHVTGPDGERLEDIQTTLMARARARVKSRN